MGRVGGGATKISYIYGIYQVPAKLYLPVAYLRFFEYVTKVSERFLKFPSRILKHSHAHGRLLGRLAPPDDIECASFSAQLSPPSTSASYQRGILRIVQSVLKVDHRSRKNAPRTPRITRLCTLLHNPL